jgi:hypothetical protein
MRRNRDPTSRGVERMNERERAVGLESDDEAARWLDEHDPKPPPATPKSAHKSKLLHRWRQQSR